LGQLGGASRPLLGGVRGLGPRENKSETETAVDGHVRLEGGIGREEREGSIIIIYTLDIMYMYLNW
jgi:hypothetical protein